MPTTSSTYRFKDKRCSCHATTQRYITVVNGLTRGVNAGYALHKPPCFRGGALTLLTSSLRVLSALSHALLSECADLCGGVFSLSGDIVSVPLEFAFECFIVEVCLSSAGLFRIKPVAPELVSDCRVNFVSTYLKCSSRCDVRVWGMRYLYTGRA